MTPETLRTNLKKYLFLAIQQNIFYNETERENVETCEKFLLPVNEKYEAFNKKWPGHGKKVDREY